MKVTSLTHFHTKNVSDIRKQFLNALPVIFFPDDVLCCIISLWYAVLHGGFSCHTAFSGKL